ncbi:hypothetical protein ACS0TY_013555 [Phlomoides rotata]
MNEAYNKDLRERAKVVAQVEEDYITSCRVELSKYGCSVMVDGWTNKRQRTLINFLVSSPRASVFIESVDGSKYEKTGEKMCELIDRIIVKVGVENVVQVIIDNASNMVFAFVNMLRKFIEGNEFCRAGVTRFATTFLTLQKMLELKKKLVRHVHFRRLDTIQMVKGSGWQEGDQP